jgi:hypothetical protein
MAVEIQSGITSSESNPVEIGEVCRLRAELGFALEVSLLTAAAVALDGDPVPPIFPEDGVSDDDVKGTIASQVGLPSLKGSPRSERPS